MYRKLIKSISFIVSILIFNYSCINTPGNTNTNTNISSPSTKVPGNPLKIPPLLQDADDNPQKAIFNLKVQQGISEFIEGTQIPTYGYNGSYLGPTIIAKRNQNIEIRVLNKLREYTTVHWHGVLVPGEMDGGPHQVIPPDGSWTATFMINQPAATAWYHPHGIGNTAIQVYRGLAGLFIIEDDNSKNLNIPKDYGINDIPLIIQDRRMTEDGLPVYMTNMNDIMEGMKGNTILVNGIMDPYLEVSAQKYRFRLLNGSNARTYDFSLDGNESFHQIATDAGLLEKPYETQILRLSPGERAEIIIDFSEKKKNQSIMLKSKNFSIIKFIVTSSANRNTEIPDTLTEIEWLLSNESTNQRNFALEGMGHHVSINGRRYNSQLINEKMKLGTQEIWNITSAAGGMMGMMRTSGNDPYIHNFHVHGIHFQILERNGQPPLPSEKGWKDTFWLKENDKVKIITRFLHNGIFMYHCHILEHEDNGMMGQFLVE